MFVLFVLLLQVHWWCRGLSGLVLLFLLLLLCAAVLLVSRYRRMLLSVCAGRYGWSCVDSQGLSLLFILLPPAGLEMRPVNDADASTSGQTGRKEAARG